MSVAHTPSPAAPPSRAQGEPSDPLELLRSPGYLRLLVLAALVGAPISAAAYFFLQAVAHAQDYIFTTLPGDIGFDEPPVWWPILPLVAAGLIVSLTITYLPGRGGHSPADGFKAAGAPPPSELPGIFLAAFATLSLGVILGPEAPLIALGAGLGALAVQLANRDAPERARAVIGSAGSFAAISTLLGNPLAGAFLLMEASGLGGATLSMVLVPGLLAAGVGTLIFIGLDSLTGLGTASFTLTGLPTFGSPTLAMFGWAIGFGVGAALVGFVIRSIALELRPFVERRLVLWMPVVGLAIAGLAIMLAQLTSEGTTSDVLFSGQDQLPSLVADANDWSIAALVLLMLCKGLGYGLSLSSFRGGPIFPAMFIGAAGGIAASDLPGLSIVPALAMGIGAMSCAMLRLPLTSVLLATLFLAPDAIDVMPLVIVAVVVAYVVTAHLTPAPGAPARS